MGDVAGIGPEVVARACVDSAIREACDVTVVGDAKVLDRTCQLLKLSCKVVELGEGDEHTNPAQTILCWNPNENDVVNVKPGQVDARAGRAAYDWLVAATRATLDGRFDAVVTAPLNKAALHLAGFDYPGHTEILAELCGVDRYAMMLYLPRGPHVMSPHGLGVAHVTLHTSIASVPGLLSTSGVREKIDLIDSFMRDVGCPAPRVAVCALNPHAGEEGLFGDEESRIISPAVASARKDGLNVVGPLPADTLMRRAIGGEFDGIVAMYHDQGHIAFKLIDQGRAVNVTLGLPIVRTSPSHGTAFDIAWKGIANSNGMCEAIRAAALLAERKRGHIIPTSA
jgi:4-hydroxythreonine-4-phosphate dehydrogenase